MGRVLDTVGDEPRMHRRMPIPRVGSGVYWVRGELGFCLSITRPTLTFNVLSRRWGSCAPCVFPSTRKR